MGVQYHISFFLQLLFSHTVVNLNGTDVIPYEAAELAAVNEGNLKDWEQFIFSYTCNLWVQGVT